MSPPPGGITIQLMSFGGKNEKGTNKGRTFETIEVNSGKIKRKF
jgi:hypothetical protein